MLDLIAAIFAIALMILLYLLWPRKKPKVEEMKIDATERDREGPKK